MALQSWFLLGIFCNHFHVVKWKLQLVHNSVMRYTRLPGWCSAKVVCLSIKSPVEKCASEVVGPVPRCDKCPAGIMPKFCSPMFCQSVDFLARTRPWQLINNGCVKLQSLNVPVFSMRQRERLFVRGPQRTAQFHHQCAGKLNRVCWASELKRQIRQNTIVSLFSHLL